MARSTKTRGHADVGGQGMRTVAIVTAAVLALPASAVWDTAGHRTVAAIAWEHMTPRARARAVELLLHGPALANFGSLRPAVGSEAARDRALFLNAATWADLVRNRDQAWHVYHHATWHYADLYWDAENGRPHDIPNTGPDSLNAAERIVALGGVERIGAGVGDVVWPAVLRVPVEVGVMPGGVVVDVPGLVAVAHQVGPGGGVQEQGAIARRLAAVGGTERAEVGERRSVQQQLDGTGAGARGHVLPGDRGDGAVARGVPH